MGRDDVAPGFQEIVNGQGGRPFPGNGADDDDGNPFAGTGSGGGVTNAVNPNTNIDNNTAQDGISRQGATFNPGVNEVNNAVIQIADATPQQEELGDLENQCEDEEKWNEFIIRIEDENLRERLKKEREAICETEDSLQADESRDS